MSLETKILWSEREDRNMKPLDFYKQYYKGLTKEEIASKDRTFYIILSYKGLLNKLVNNKPKEKKVSVKIKEEGHYRPIIKPSLLINLAPKKQAIYKEKIIAKPKNEISLKINLIPDNIEEIIKSYAPKRIYKNKYTRKTPKNPWTDNPILYYQEHYQGLTPKELEKENPRFYKYLWRHKLLEAVPRKTLDYANKIISTARRRDSKFGEDAFAYYQEHYTGTSRGILKEKDSGLYQRLRKDNLLDKVPMNIQTNKYSDPVKYYNENYFGITRGELKKKSKGLYERLREEKLLEKVPL